MEIRAASVRRICEMYGLGRTKVYALLAKGEIAGRKVGRRTLIDTESMEAWINRQPVYPGRKD
jgi:excisionase family DNA binding protein